MILQLRFHLLTWLLGYIFFFMLNSVEHKMCPANKSQIINNRTFFLANIAAWKSLLMNMKCQLLLEFFYLLAEKISCSELSMKRVLTRGPVPSFWFITCDVNRGLFILLLVPLVNYIISLWLFVTIHGSIEPTYGIILLKSRLHYENTPIQIYWKLHQKLKVFRYKLGYFSYFRSKHRLWVRVRTASQRRL